MKIEIQYLGRVLHSFEMPNNTRLDDLKMFATVSSKAHTKEEFEQPKNGKKLHNDAKLAPIEEKEPVEFKRAKPVFSNTNYQDY